MICDRAMEEAFLMMGCLAVVGFLSTVFLLGWGICALVRWAL